MNKKLAYNIFDPNLFETNRCSKKLKLLMASACMVAIKSTRRAELFHAALTEGVSTEELIEATSIGFLMGSSHLLQSYKSLLYASIKKYLKEEIDPSCIDDFFAQENQEVQFGFEKFYSAVYRDGVINSKDKELIAISLSIALKCDTCESSHTMKALKQNSSDEEIEEAKKIGQYIIAFEALITSEFI